MTATGTEARVCDFIAERQRFGINKYGTTVEANPLEAWQWLQHLKEELADALVYIQRLQDEVAKLAKPSEQWKREQFERNRAPSEWAAFEPLDDGK